MKVPREFAMTTHYSVVTDYTGWSYIIGPTSARSGPWRNKSEAEDVANDMNAEIEARDDHPEA